MINPLHDYSHVEFQNILAIFIGLQFTASTALFQWRKPRVRTDYRRNIYHTRLPLKKNPYVAEGG